MKLPLIYYPTPSLQKTSIKIDDIKAVQKIVSDMVETMLSHNGIGLAAPQIGKNIRLAIINKEADATLSDHLVIINPKMFSASRELEESKEGCLSIPEVGELKIMRHRKIKVRYTDVSGQERKLKATGLLAQVFQHEIDHLDGILIIDRVTSK